MKLPAMPVRSGRDATLNFDKLMKVAEWPFVFSTPLVFENYGPTEFRPATAYKNGLGFVTVSGLIKVVPGKNFAYGAESSIITTLPEGWRPQMRLLFLTWHVDDAAGKDAVRIDISQQGQIIITSSAAPTGSGANNGKTAFLPLVGHFYAGAG